MSERAIVEIRLVKQKRYDWSTIVVGASLCRVANPRVAVYAMDINLHFPQRPISTGLLTEAIRIPTGQAYQRPNQRQDERRERRE